MRGRERGREREEEKKKKKRREGVLLCREKRSSNSGGFGGELCLCDLFPDQLAASRTFLFLV